MTFGLKDFLFLILVIGSIIYPIYMVYAERQTSPKRNCDQGCTLTPHQLEQAVQYDPSLLDGLPQDICGRTPKSWLINPHDKNRQHWFLQQLIVFTYNVMSHACRDATYKEVFDVAWRHANECVPESEVYISNIFSLMLEYNYGTLGPENCKIGHLKSTMKRLIPLVDYQMLVGMECKNMEQIARQGLDDNTIHDQKIPFKYLFSKNQPQSLPIPGGLAWGSSRKIDVYEEDDDVVDIFETRGEWFPVYLRKDADTFKREPNYRDQILESLIERVALHSKQSSTPSPPSSPFPPPPPPPPQECVTQPISEPQPPSQDDSPCTNSDACYFGVASEEPPENEICIGGRNRICESTLRKTECPRGCVIGLEELKTDLIESPHIFDIFTNPICGKSAKWWILSASSSDSSSTSLIRDWITMRYNMRNNACVNEDIITLSDAAWNLIQMCYDGDLTIHRYASYLVHRYNKGDFGPKTCTWNDCRNLTHANCQNMQGYIDNYNDMRKKESDLSTCLLDKSFAEVNKPIHNEEEGEWDCPDHDTCVFKARGEKRMKECGQHPSSIFRNVPSPPDDQKPSILKFQIPKINLTAEQIKNLKDPQLLNELSFLKILCAIGFIVTFPPFVIKNVGYVLVIWFLWRNIILE